MIPQSRYTGRTGMDCIYLMALIFICCFAFLGCGGGSGGSGGGGGGSNNITYSGLETPAQITADNANAISANALETRMNPGGFTDIAPFNAAGRTAQQSYQPFLLNISMAAKSALEVVDYDIFTAQHLPSAVQTHSEIINGACGGNASLSLKVDDQTGSFSGSITFNGICNDGVTLTGPADFSGVINPNTSELESFTMSFNYVTGASATESYTMDGQVDIIISGSTVIGTMDMAIQDNQLGRVCKVEDYQLVVTDWSGQAEIEISGRFYDPDYGYVVLETESTLMYDEMNDYPTSGVVLLTGELGSAGGATKARLTALSATQCQVEADTNGDGSYDYNSGPVPWTELENPV